MMRHGHCYGGGILLFAMLLGGLAAVPLSADLQSLSLRIRLAALERNHALLLRAAEYALYVAEREAVALDPALMPCAGAACFAAHCPRGYCFSGEYTDDACSLPAGDAVQDKPQAWRNARSVVHPSSGQRFLRLIEFRCFLPEQAQLIPLFRITVQTAAGEAAGGRSLSLQSLYSQRGRHGWRRLE